MRKIIKSYIEKWKLRGIDRLNKELIYFINRRKILLKETKINDEALIELKKIIELKLLGEL